MLAHYHQALGRIRRELTLLHDLAAHAREEELAARAETALARVRPRPFRIAFVGEFKSGKSSLVNALAGTDVLPVATRECTTVITRVRADPHASTPTAQARTASGGQRTLTVDEADALLQNRETAADPVVEVELRLTELPGFGDNVELVDTPGSGAAGRVRELVTLGWLPNADAVVFVTRADQLMTASEMAFLRDGVLTIDPTGVFVVVNRKDEVGTAGERRELEGRLRKRLEPVLGPGFRAWWTCAADAMDAAAALREVYDDEPPDPDDVAEWEDSGVPQLRSALAGFLSEHRVAADLARHRRVAERIAAELESRIDHRLRRFRMDGEAIERRAERARLLEAHLRAERSELCDAVAATFRTRVRSALDQVAREATATLTQMLRGATSEQHAHRAIEQTADRALARMQSTLLGEWRSVQDMALARLVALEARSELADLERRAGLRWSARDLGGALQMRTELAEIVEHERTPSTSSDEAIAVGASVGTMLGFAMAGPVGGMIGAWAGYALTTSGQVREVRRTVEQRRVDVGHTISDYSRRLHAVAESAVGVAERLTVESIRAATDERLADLRARSTVESESASLDEQALRATLDQLRSVPRADG